MFATIASDHRPPTITSKALVAVLHFPLGFWRLWSCEDTTNGGALKTTSGSEEPLILGRLVFQSPKPYRPHLGPPNWLSPIVANAPSIPTPLCMANFDLTEIIYTSISIETLNFKALNNYKQLRWFVCAYGTQVPNLPEAMSVWHSQRHWSYSSPIMLKSYYTWKVNFASGELPQNPSGLGQLPK